MSAALPLRITPLAARDLKELGRYIAADNPARALTFVQEIRAKCQAIALNPESFPLREELGEGVRIAVFGRYLIIYRIMSDSARIERVLHSSRNILLGAESS